MKQLYWLRHIYSGHALRSTQRLTPKPQHKTVGKDQEYRKFACTGAPTAAVRCWRLRGCCVLASVSTYMCMGLFVCACMHVCSSAFVLVCASAQYLCMHLYMSCACVPVRASVCSHAPCSWNLMFHLNTAKSEVQPWYFEDKPTARLSEGNTALNQGLKY